MAYVASMALPIVVMLITDYGLVFIIVIIMVAKRVERLVHMSSSAIHGILRLSASSSA